MGGIDGMTEVRIRERCAECDGKGSPDFCCSSCEDGYIEAWLPLSDILELAARALRESG